MYVGHLLSVPDLRPFHDAQPGGMFLPCVVAPRPGACTGDPVFIVDASERDPSIRFHCCISYTEMHTVEGAWAKFGPWLEASSDADFASNVIPRFAASRDSTIQMMMLTYVTPVSPPVRLHAVGLAVPSAVGEYDVSAEQVLSILQSLPEAARSDWTRRVVARNNDL